MGSWTVIPPQLLAPLFTEFLVEAGQGVRVLARRAVATLADPHHRIVAVVVGDDRQIAVALAVVMRVIEDHLALRARIMPDHAGNRDLLHPPSLRGDCPHIRN